MDLDDSGFIDTDELGLILKSLGEVVPPGRLKALVREVNYLLAQRVQCTSSLNTFNQRTIDTEIRQMFCRCIGVPL